MAEIFPAMTGLMAGDGGAFNMLRYFEVILTLAVIGVTVTTRSAPAPFRGKNPLMRLSKKPGFGLSVCLPAWASPVTAEPFRIILTGSEVPLVLNSALRLAEREGCFAREGVKLN